MERTDRLQEIKEALIKLIEMPQEDRRELFDGANFRATLKNYTFDQIMGRLEQYEDSRKAFDIGDVLCSDGIHVIVVGYSSWGDYNCITKSGGLLTIDVEDKKEWKRTGENVADRLKLLWCDDDQVRPAKKRRNKQSEE